MLSSHIATQSAPASRRRPKPGIGRRLWNDRWIYLFLLPTIALYALFTFWPIIASYWYSLLDWNGFSSDQTFVGLANYREVVHDPLFWRAFKNSFIYMAGVVPCASASR